MQAEKENYELGHLLDQLKKDSKFLGNHQEACAPMWDAFTGKIYSFYETRKTKTVVSVSLHTQTMSGW
jgi:hypothetical protein